MNLQAICFTLDQYIEEDNFTAGSTFVFLAGNHTPHHQMNLTDIGHVTLRGEDNDSTINIICQNRITIRCNNVTNLKISELTFILNQNERASVLHISNSREVIISNSVFLGKGTVSSQAIHTNQVHLNITHCLFRRNTAREGGAIIALNGSILAVYESKFTQNRASQSGGAIYGSESTIMLGGAQLSNNSAGRYGGAIACDYCSIGSVRNNTFDNNYSKSRGGAIYLYNGNISITPAAYYINNSVTEGGGGAIYLHRSEAIFNGDISGNSIKDNNTLEWTSFKYKGVVIFFNNTADTSGGAIYMKNNFMV